MTARIEMLVEFMRGKSGMATTAELKAFIKEKFKIQWRQSVEYIARAREEIAKGSKLSKEHVSELIHATLLDQLKNGNPVIRIRAAEQLISIHGLKAPARQELTGAEGGPIATKNESDPLDGLSIEDLKRLANAVADK